MSPFEAAQLVAILAARYRTTFDAADWSDQLTRYERAVGAVAVERWFAFHEEAPTLVGFVAVLQSAARETAAQADTSVFGDGPCPECGGGGMTVVEPGVPGTARHSRTVRPCSMCNGRAYERWAGGHYLPDHECPECRELAKTPVRRGRKT